jgi:EAL domain-containing protein (putative c-di-GMP-specific phosphodiesterase class I)
LGEWVLRQACQQMMAWHAQGFKVPKIAVNVSVKQLEHGQIVERVTSALHDSGLPASVLELEITESVIMNITDDLSVLEQLSSLGVQLAIDDFGTGYSSLAYLKVLPVDTLKIDRAFVMGIGHNEGDEAIIRAVVALAASLRLRTVAEGVETEQQRDFLFHQGVDEIQGFLYAPAQPADAFARHWQTRLR